VGYVKRIRGKARWRRREMEMKKAILDFYALLTILGITFTANAQPIIPKENIPSKLPPDVRKYIEQLYSPDEIDRASATFSLRKTGERAAPAIPFLIAMLGDNTAIEHGGPPTSPGEEAGRTLVSMGEKAIEPVIRALSHEHLGIRRMAAWILGKMENPRAVEPLATALKDDHRNVRMMAAWALAEIGGPAVESLTTTLRDKKSQARGDAAWALAKIGDHRAIGPLVEALKEENPSLREDAAKALEKITGMDFGVNPDQWETWWEQNQGKK
jgi:HEAT repeat protein